MNFLDDCEPQFALEKCSPNFDIEKCGPDFELDQVQSYFSLEDCAPQWKIEECLPNVQIIDSDSSSYSEQKNVRQFPSRAERREREVDRDEMLKRSMDRGVRILRVIDEELSEVQEQMAAHTSSNVIAIGRNMESALLELRGKVITELTDICASANKISAA